MILLDVCRASVPRRPPSCDVDISRPTSLVPPPTQSTNDQSLFLPRFQMTSGQCVIHSAGKFQLLRSTTKTCQLTRVSQTDLETSLRNVAPKLPATKPRLQSQVRPIESSYRRSRRAIFIPSVLCRLSVCLTGGLVTRVDSRHGADVLLRIRDGPLLHRWYSSRYNSTRYMYSKTASSWSAR